MPRITVAQARGWAEKTKLNIQELDVDLLDQIETEVLGRINSTYDTSVWTDETNTPRLVQVAIAKKYVVWFYQRQYSENVPRGGSSYALALDANAEMLVDGIVDGTIELPGIVSDSGAEPIFYPNDQSSAMDSTPDDLSLGPAKFSMGQIF